MDRHGVGQIQLVHIFQWVVGIAPVIIDGNRAVLDSDNKPGLAVKYSGRELLAPAVMQYDVVIIFDLHDPIPQTEHFSAPRDLRFFRF